MEYVYAAMLLHSVGKEINEDSVKKVLQATGAEVDSARVKALIAALKDVNIDEVISKAAVAPTTAAAPAPSASDAEKKESPAEEVKKTEEEAASGLSALFG